MDKPTQTIRLKLPEQDLQCLTIGSDNPKHLQAWLDGLPLMNMGETSRQLYQFMQELNRLQTSSRTRFQLLEIARPVINLVCNSLAKHYLNQSLVLPEKSRKVASLAQALQSHLATGYKLVAVRSISKLKDKDARASATTAIHRAIAAMTDSLVRCYQLYFPVPKHLWLELHQLYLLGERNALVSTPVTDSTFKTVEASTIKDAYARALLLATAKPNQLRQQEISQIYKATEQWSTLLEIKEAGADADLFVFDLEADRPPTYRTHASATTRITRYLESGQLVEALGKLAHHERAAIALPKHFPEPLLQHLQQAWGALTERSFKRISDTGSIGVCLGLGAIHSFSSGGVDFATQLRGGKLGILSDDSDNPFLNPNASQHSLESDPVKRNLMRDADPWSQAYDAGSHKMSDDTFPGGEEIDISKISSSLQQTEASEKASFEQYNCEKVNSSPGGYCLNWSGDAPAQLRTGEIIGLKESGQPNWAIGVVRWVKQVVGQGAQFGVELLAPRANPCGTRVLKKTGSATQFMRTLILPELHAIGQPATLLTPTVGFQTGYKAEVVDNGQSMKIILSKRVNTTASFSQFEFRVVGGQGTTPAGEAGKPEDDFDSIWTNL